MSAAKIYLLVTTLVVVLATSSSCKKYLDKQSNKALIVAQSLSDLQSVLDNYTIMNQSYSDLNEAIAADFNYGPSFPYGSLVAYTRLSYIWDANADFARDWEMTPQIYYFANVVLDELPKLANPSSTTESNDIQGQALFFRSFAFYHLAQLYCRPYSATAASDLGLPLRLTADFNPPSLRSTVEQTYTQILNDFKIAARLLPVNVISPSRPGKAAAYGALARTYLSMRDYVNAGKYADSCLQISHALLDYNSLNPASPNPVPNLNPEVVFWSIQNSGYFQMDNANAVVDPALYQSYDNNDLRKQIFYLLNADGVNHGFKGSYGYFNNFSIFNGIATDEMYLIRAEAYARTSNKDAALADLNTLLAKRWKNSVTFPSVTATDANDALQKIKVERRKELPGRGLRWTDLRRFNLEGANLTLSRTVNGTTYTLPPNDLRWVWLFPSTVTTVTHIEQNPR
jgi:hypothetical protein